MSISDRTAAIVSGTALVIYGALKRGPAGAIAIGIGGAIAYLAMRPGSDAVISGRQVLRGSHTMNAEPYDAFVHWQDLSKLPSALRGIGAVKKLDNGNWRYALPGIGSLEVRIDHEDPGHVIEWRSVEGSKVDAHGVVRFTRKKNGRGTKVHMEITHAPASQSAGRPELQMA